MSESALGTQVVCQVGLVVRDIAQAAERYSRLFGLPMPEIITTDPYEMARTTYRGQPTQARAKLAFFHMGQVQLELIEPVGGPSTWQRFLEEKGEGVHHIAFIIQDTPAITQRLAELGMPVEQQGYYTGGMYTYIDSSTQLGVILELLENFAEQGAN